MSTISYSAAVLQSAEDSSSPSRIYVCDKPDRFADLQEELQGDSAWKNTTTT